MRKSPLLLLAVLLASCATTKDWSAVGGSRADATVRLGYRYGMMEKASVDAAQGVRLATDKCKAWGYERAEPFGSQLRSCAIPMGLNGCSEWQVIAEFQCVGAPASK